MARAVATVVWSIVCIFVFVATQKIPPPSKSLKNTQINDLASIIRIMRDVVKIVKQKLKIKDEKFVLNTDSIGLKNIGSKFKVEIQDVESPNMCRYSLNGNNWYVWNIICITLAAMAAAKKKAPGDPMHAAKHVHAKTLVLQKYTLNDLEIFFNQMLQFQNFKLDDVQAQLKENARAEIFWDRFSPPNLSKAVLSNDHSFLVINSEKYKKADHPQSLLDVTAFVSEKDNNKYVYITPRKTFIVKDFCEAFEAFAVSRQPINDKFDVVEYWATDLFTLGKKKLPKEYILLLMQKICQIFQCFDNIDSIHPLNLVIIGSSHKHQMKCIDPSPRKKTLWVTLNKRVDPLLWCLAQIYLFLLTQDDGVLFQSSHDYSQEIGNFFMKVTDIQQAVEFFSEEQNPYRR